MNFLKKYNIRNILLTFLWVAIGSASVVLLVAAVRKKDEKHCKGIDISISGVSNNFFIDKDDVRRIVSVYSGKNAIGKKIEEFNLRAMEAALKKDIWIKNADLFFDNNERLRVNVEEREPVARVFTNSGNTFYIDSSNVRLPLSEKFSARVPVFTGFPTDVIILSKADSNLLQDIKTISITIQADSFLMAMIEQVDITPRRDFEMIPKIGNHVIVFGDASGEVKKFRKLKLFYKKVITKVGWDRYSIINLQYSNQVVAKIRGKDDVQQDSLRTIQMMEAIAANAARMSEDTLVQFAPENDRKNTSDNMIQQSIQREEIGDNSNTDEEPKPQERMNLRADKPAVAPVAKKKPKPTIKPPAKIPAERKASQKQPAQPKAVMPKKNDY